MIDWNTSYSLSVFDSYFPLFKQGREVWVRIEPFYKGLADNEQFLRDLLVKNEVRQFKSYSKIKRRSEWLAGRLAAKCSVESYCDSHGYQELKLRQIQIVTDSLGAPFAKIPHYPHRLNVSITHCKTWSAAVATPSYIHIGIDIEEIRPLSESFKNVCFSQIERKRETSAFIRRWVVKEAIFKALGIGLRYDPREIEIVDIYGDGRCKLSLNGAVEERLFKISNKMPIASVGIFKDVVVGRALIYTILN